MTNRARSTVQTGHVGLNVTELGRSVDFYQQALGFSVLGRSDESGRRFAFLGSEQTLVLTLWEQGRGSFDPRAPGLHHLSFQVDSSEEVLLAEQRLRSMGAELAHGGVVSHGEGAASGGIFFFDPDGTRLEIFAPTGAEGAPAPSAGAPTCGFF
jgi:catechol-2,3-dioxygenase